MGLDPHQSVHDHWQETFSQGDQAALEDSVKLHQDVDGAELVPISADEVVQAIERGGLVDRLEWTWCQLNSCKRWRHSPRELSTELLGLPDC